MPTQYQSRSLVVLFLQRAYEEPSEYRPVGIRSIVAMVLSIRERG